MVTLGTGVGGGIFIGGKPSRGARGFGGEVGHLVIDVDGPPCPCGGRGHLESYAARPAIVRDARAATASYQGSSISRLVDGDLDALTAEMVVQAANEGDEAAVAVMAHVGDMLGEALVGLVNVLNPHAIVVGGGIGESCPLVLTRAADRIAKEALAGRRDVRVLVAELGNDAGVAGAGGARLRRFRLPGGTPLMPSTVYFAPVRSVKKRSMVARVGGLLERAGLAAAIETNDLVAVKLHFGEAGNTGFVQPIFVREVVARIKAHGGKPFLTDANTLYSGMRANAVDHLQCAIQNGFSYATVEAPIVIADGIDGQDAVDVPVDGKHFDSVRIGAAAVRADAMVVITHVKGHEATGFGGALKNVGMGLGCRSAKQRMHSDFRPGRRRREVHGVRPVREALPGRRHRDRSGPRRRGGLRSLLRLRRVCRGLSERCDRGPVEDDRARSAGEDRRTREGRAWPARKARSSTSRS